MSNILYIDTTSSEYIETRLDAGSARETKRKQSGRDKAQVLLGMINDLLREANIKIQEIDKISVNRGPGSYTGIRVGLTIANALGVLLGIPINDKKAGEIEPPIYNAI